LQILLLSPPLSYPLPLLSLTTHLALLSTRLPRLKSELDEDPMFDDDWDASVYLYPRNKSGKGRSRPPVTLLVMAVKDNIIFDPSKEELAVAEVVLAVSVAEEAIRDDAGAMDVDEKSRNLRLLSVRTIDPPSRLTAPGVPNTLNTATGGTAPKSAEQSVTQRENVDMMGVWQAPRGGAKRKMIAAMIRKVLDQGGVAEEVLDGLDSVELA
jgi:exosome complex component RRP42